MIIFSQIVNFFIVYIDIGGSRENDLTDSVATLEFTFDQVIGSRLFDMRISQLECNSKTDPPAGCLQYFTGIEGKIILK